MSAWADTDQWKRRASILFLKVSSVQEDVDMYSMRCQLLEAEILRESSQAKDSKVRTPIQLDAEVLQACCAIGALPFLWGA